MKVVFVLVKQLNRGFHFILQRRLWNKVLSEPSAHPSLYLRCFLFIFIYLLLAVLETELRAPPLLGQVLYNLSPSLQAFFYCRQHTM
jgi:hypothetical protein